MYRSWSITTRPRAGLTDEQLEALDRFGHKAQFHLHGVEKKDAARHSHLGVYLSKPSTKSNICNRVLSIPAFRSLDDDEKRTFRKGVKIMYNTDWIMGYVGDEAKDEEYIEASRNLPDDLTDLDAFYPAEDDAQSKRPLSIWFVTMERHWQTHPDGYARFSGYATEENISDFMYDMMNYARIIEVIADPRVFRQKALALSRFITHFVGRRITRSARMPEM